MKVLKKLAITCGGTGGHINPALAIAGTVGSVEYHLVAADYLGFKPLKILDEVSEPENF